MKKLMFVCGMWITLCGAVLAGSLQTIIPTDTPPKNSAIAVKEEVHSLMERIQAAKAMNQTPDEALYARLEALLTESESYSTLDCGRNNDTEVSKQGAGACDSATVINALPYTDSAQLDLTDNCTGRPYNDVFYVFTAPSTADYEIDMCGSYGDSYLRLWLDGTCCVGNTVTEDDSCGNNSLDPKLHISLNAGQTMYIECGLNSSSSRRRAYRLHVEEMIHPPLNDLCGGAVPLTVPSETFASTVMASVDQAPSCGLAGAVNAKGIWYTVVGNGHLLTATTCSDRTTFDTKISIYNGYCNDLLCVAGNDDDPNCTGFRSTVTWCSEAGVLYYILVHGYDGANGNFLLALSSGDPCGSSSCEALPLCGEPAEVEPNNLCPPPETQAAITCNAAVYGRICMAVAADQDFWKIVVPPYSILTLSQFEGEGCTISPTVCLRSSVYFNNCTLAGENSSATGWTATNETPDPFVFFIKLYGVNACQISYKLTATCCPIRNYCENPIVIPGVTHFESPVNTCCATNPIPAVASMGCSGTAYSSGSDVIYLMNLSQPTTVSMTATGGDPQLMIFRDCADPAGTCVASADILSGSSESIYGLTLPAGIYYVSMSMYSAPGTNACGDMLLVIDGDHPLPVELTSFTAAGGDGSVSLNWRTASENNNERFELVRDDHTVTAVSSQGNGSTEHRYTWTETGLYNGNTYHYTLYSVDMEGTRAALGTAEATPSQTAMVTEYALYQNYPNPFNPTTQISFDLMEAGYASLKVYNLMGQSVADLVNANVSSGHHVVTLNATNLPSGVYLYRLNVNGFAAEKKMLLLK